MGGFKGSSKTLAELFPVPIDLLNYCFEGQAKILHHETTGQKVTLPYTCQIKVLNILYLYLYFLVNCTLFKAFFLHQRSNAEQTALTDPNTNVFQLSPFKS